MNDFESKLKEIVEIDDSSIYEKICNSAFDLDIEYDAEEIN